MDKLKVIAVVMVVVVMVALIVVVLMVMVVPEVVKVEVNDGMMDGGGNVGGGSSGGGNGVEGLLVMLSLAGSLAGVNTGGARHVPNLRAALRKWRGGVAGPGGRPSDTVPAMSETRLLTGQVP